MTIVTKDREKLLGNIADGVFLAGPAAKDIQYCWSRLPERFEGLQLDEIQIMPDHVHFIVVITSISSGRTLVKPDYTLSDVVRSLKTNAARVINIRENSPGRKRWQKGFIERIIRSESELNKFRRYIVENPLRWKSN